MKMNDIGHKRDSTVGVEPSAPTGKSYPTVELNEEQCPFIKDWPTGEDYTLTIKVHKIGDHEPRAWDYGGDNKAMRHEFEIREVGYEEKNET